MRAAFYPNAPCANDPRGAYDRIVPKALSSNVTDVALIFEGGGMRASLTSAVIPTLLTAGIYIDYVTGISAGSTNAVNYISRDPERARRSFVDFVGDPKMGNWRTFAQGRGYFDSEYIYEHTSLPHQALPLDFETFQENPAKFKIGGFRCDTGEQVHWGRQDVHVLHDLLVRVRASCSMPVLMPPVTIGEGVYLDGALGPAGGIPLDIAKADGYEKFLVIATKPREYWRPPMKHTRALRGAFRKYPAVVDALVERPGNYNRTKEEVLELEREGKAMVFFPEVMPVENSERDVAKLAAAHELGLAQAARELPAWKEWLGVVG